MIEPTGPDAYAAARINTLQENINHLANQSDGTPRNLNFEQAATVAALQGQLATASALLAVAAAIAR
ncbi:hypothetical protein [Kitasatospora sp. NPDC057223]|uniref:hypothetical protein n=1 Tax=Kitasatospora sp. NPDC057223 TaxID=3346055 RepID=UPI003643C02D